MNYKMMGRLNSFILMINAVFMLPALIISIFCAEHSSTLAFGVTIGIMLAVAGILALLSKGAKKDFFAREGIVCVGTCWIIMSLLSALPFHSLPILLAEHCKPVADKRKRLVYL